MASFSFNTAAELFPAAIRKKKRAGFAYRRFGTAAEAVRFAIEELPADSLNGAYLQVDEARFDQSGIRSLSGLSVAAPPPQAGACQRQGGHRGRVNSDDHRELVRLPVDPAPQ
jgi:hypothetical protein